MSSAVLTKPPSPAEELRIAEILRSMGISPEMVRQASATVLSVVPDTLVSRVYLHFGMRKIYTIPPADPDKGYSTLTVHNTFQYILDTSRSEDDIMASGHQYKQAIITAGQVADELVREFAGDHQANRSGGNIGVARIRNPVPTSQEIAELKTARRVFNEALVLQADSYHTQSQPKLIGFEHRRAFEALVPDPTPEDLKLHPWFVPIGSMIDRNRVPEGCAACGKPILLTAFKCSECGTDLAEFFMRRKKSVDPQKMPGVFEEIQFRLAEQATAQGAQEKAPTPKGAAAMKT